MGHLTQSVLEGLKGQNLSVSKTHPKSGKPYEKKLAAQQMALLLTVASQQEALPRNNCGESPAWTADPKTVCAYTHTKSSAFHEDRNFLIELGLLERVKSSYRVCTSKLRNTESSTSEPPSELRNTESSEKTTNEAYIKRVAQSIADMCNIDSNLINLSDVADAIKDKFPNSVYKVIREIWEMSGAAKATPTIILTALRGLPDQKVDPAYKRATESNHHNRRDHGGKGNQTRTMQEQLSAFKARMLENNYSPEDKYARARDFWLRNKGVMEKAQNAKGEKKGYSSYQALANAYWNDLGKCPKIMT